MTHDPHLETTAIDWLMRQRDPAFEDWEAFADWLAADPAHQRVYAELSALDADLAGLPGPPARHSVGDVDASPAAPRRFGRRQWLAGALAASLVGVVSIGLLQRAPDSYRIETAPGQMEVVSLEDGSNIVVNGGSSVLLSHADPRRATVERGQALFTVRHSDEAPFRVAVGNAQLVDVGTVFDVTRTDDRTVVAVSEGAVIYNPDADAVRVDAGARLAVRDGGAADVSPVSLAAVGGWRSGQLVYDGVPLADVAAEVSRTTGIPIRTAPGAGGILFRGALQAGRDETRIVNDLAGLSGTRATRDSGGWTLAR
ncbi:putative anti-sigma factor [Sphingobium sp. SYK-6]|uniref:FecR family protein n=1 Tax=Sphingobium sp. (strain NBRC 103272 / SYK-6) TaxID=627192 RepID=UPI00022766B9|nr:FecR domain-containing protein [Sphingobium sp. SYK-6]BAK65120.1 putative anti-sigma factor [Sphingobium sp. SYK-6]